LGEYFHERMLGLPSEFRDGHRQEHSDEFQDGQLRVVEPRDERERRKKDRGEKHSRAFWSKEFWNEEPVELEDELRDAAAKSERRARESRKEDETVRTVLVSALAILFACEVDARLRREKFREFVNLRRELPPDFAERRANNYFSARIRFSSLRFARDLPESKCGDA